MISPLDHQECWTIAASQYACMRPMQLTLSDHHVILARPIFVAIFLIFIFIIVSLIIIFRSFITGDVVLDQVGVSAVQAAPPAQV